LGICYLIDGDTGAEAWIRWARAKAVAAGAVVANEDQDQPEPRPRLAPAAVTATVLPAPVLEGVVTDHAAARKAARDAAVRAHPDMAWLRAISGA
jgi:hypothetical protein